MRYRELKVRRLFLTQSFTIWFPEKCKMFLLDLMLQFHTAFDGQKHNKVYLKWKRNPIPSHIHIHRPLFTF